MKQDVWTVLSASIAERKRQKNYIITVEEWCRYLCAAPGTKSGAAKLLRATSADAKLYRQWCEAQPGAKVDGKESTRALATIELRINILKALYRTLKEAGLVRGNPFFGMKVKVNESDRKFPTQMIPLDRVQELLSAPDLQTEKGRRDAAMLALLFTTAIRRSELIALKVGDFRRTDAGTCYIYLAHTKAGEPAELAVPEWCSQSVISWIDERIINGAESSEPIFPISDRTLARTFKRYCAAVGLDHKVLGCHSARATVITKLLADGYKHEEVKEISRHSSVIIVERYDKRKTELDRSINLRLSYAAK
jgi:integrase/recombinase XerD